MGRSKTSKALKDPNLRKWVEQKERDAKLLQQAKRRTFKEEPVKAKWSYKIDQLQSLYIIICGDFFKIGISLNPQARLSGIQTGNPNPCYLYRVWKPRHAASIERQMHKRFKHHQISGEWFSRKILDHATNEIQHAVGRPPTYELHHTGT